MGDHSIQYAASKLLEMKQYSNPNFIGTILVEPRRSFVSKKTKALFMRLFPNKTRLITYLVDFFWSFVKYDEYKAKKSKLPVFFVRLDRTLARTTFSRAFEVLQLYVAAFHDENLFRINQSPRRWHTFLKLISSVPQTKPFYELAIDLRNL
jgi:hypothetical protein